MKTIIITYSLSGNNKNLAQRLSKEIDAHHTVLKEIKSRNMWTITWDIIFNRTPKIELIEDKLEDYDLVIFNGPVWMGHIATPFRSLFKRYKNRIGKYMYISISGGADGDNLNLEKELTERMETSPELIIDLHIAQLLPPDPKPERKDTMHYKLTHEDIDVLIKKIKLTLAKSGFQFESVEEPSIVGY